MHYMWCMKKHKLFMYHFRYLLGLSSILFFETGSLTEPVAYPLARLAVQQAPKSLIPSLSAGITSVLYHAHLFYAGTGDSNSGPNGVLTEPSTQNNLFILTQEPFSIIILNFLKFSRSSHSGRFYFLKFTDIGFHRAQNGLEFIYPRLALN